MFEVGLVDIVEVMRMFCCVVFGKTGMIYTWFYSPPQRTVCVALITNGLLSS